MLHPIIFISGFASGLLFVLFLVKITPSPASEAKKSPAVSRDSMQNGKQDKEKQKKHDKSIEQGFINLLNY